MPIYDFQCRSCGKISEMFVRDLNGTFVNCPDCSSKDMEKLISAPAIMKMTTSTDNTTCCGREDPCETSPCSTGEQCRRA